MKDKNHSSGNGKIEVRGGDFFKSQQNRYVDGTFYLKAKKPNRPMESLTLSQVKEIRIPDHAERNELYEYAGLNVFPSFKYALPYWLFEKCDTYLVVEFTDGRKLFGKTAEDTYNRMPDSLKKTRDEAGVPGKPGKTPLIKLLLPLLGVSYILLLSIYAGVDIGSILFFVFLMLLFLAPFKFKR
jgi:hypothetical protein